MRATHQNLTVTKTTSKSKGRREADVYEVVAGGRQLAALQLLAQRKTIPKDYPVPCKIVDDGAEELSLVENTVRQAMHPGDQFEAFNRLHPTRGIGHHSTRP